MTTKDTTCESGGTKTPFKYGVDEFFYDESFDDYPMRNTSVFKAIDDYLNDNGNQYTPWSYSDGIRSYVFNGEKLKQLGAALLNTEYFSNLTIDSFLPLNTPLVNEHLRLISYQEAKLGETPMTLHRDLKILSIRIKAIDYNFDVTTIDLFITAHIETMNGVDL